MKNFLLKFKKILICLIILPLVVMFPIGCGDDSEGGGGTGKVNNDSYTVHFFTGSNETFNIPSQTVKKGGLVNKPDNPRRTGYVFIGWYIDMECSVVWTFEIDTVNNDMTLYARWQKRQA